MTIVILVTVMVVMVAMMMTMTTFTNTTGKLRRTVASITALACCRILVIC